MCRRCASAHKLESATDEHPLLATRHKLLATGYGLRAPLDDTRGLYTSGLVSLSLDLLDLDLQYRYSARGPHHRPLSTHAAAPAALLSTWLLMLHAPLLDRRLRRLPL